MARFRFLSLLHSSAKSTASAEKERKQNNRRSFSAFSSVPILRHKEATSRPSAINGTAKPSTVPEESDTPSRMTELSKKIATETAKLESYMKEHELEMPGLGVDAPADFPKLPEDIQRSRMEIVHASSELERLVQGPKQTMRWMVWDFLDTLAIQVLNNYGIRKHFFFFFFGYISSLDLMTPLLPLYRMY